MHRWDGAFRKVVMVDYLGVPAVHVLYSHVDAQGSCQGTDVDVVALPIHGVHLLYAAEIVGT